VFAAVFTIVFIAVLLATVLPAVFNGVLVTPVLPILSLSVGLVLVEVLPLAAFPKAEGAPYATPFPIPPVAAAGA
jgi:hypothetical protein